MPAAAVEPVPPPPKIDPRVWETPPSRVAAMPNSPSRRHRADTSAGSPGSSSSASTSNRGSFECHICLTSKSSFQDKESLQMHWLVAHGKQSFYFNQIFFRFVYYFKWLLYHMDGLKVIVVAVSISAQNAPVFHI